MMVKERKSGDVDGAVVVGWWWSDDGGMVVMGW
jgi:hypothetical protein